MAVDLWTFTAQNVRKLDSQSNIAMVIAATNAHIVLSFNNLNHLLKHSLRNN